MSNGPDPVVRVEGLHKSYLVGDVTVHALRGVDLSIASGAFVAVVGASGSGKSTFMNVLGLLDQPTSGHYWLRGEDVAGFDRDRRAILRNRTMGFVFQSFNLLARTSALENVELPLLYNGKAATSAERHRKAREMLETVSLGERLDHTPGQLSGGQQQRVAIARALVNDPESLLADEPTGNLDSRTSIEIMEILQGLNRNQGITVILVTHEPDIAEFAQRVIAFKDGRVVKDTPVHGRREAARERAALPPPDGDA
jgi:putative ABC transport system ATP-binding protein